MNFNFSAPFFVIYPNEGCPRLDTYNMTVRTTIIGSFIFFLGMINITVHSLLLAVIATNWTYMFSNEFVYKLIINMNIMSILYSIVTFIGMSPCIVFGCTNYPTDLLEILTETWRGMEYGVYWTLFFIAIDRFFVFYWQGFGAYFQRFYTLVLLWILTFLFQNVMFFAGCPKIFDLVRFSPVPCRNCMFFGVSWNDTSRAIIYNMPYPMFLLYILIFAKILATRFKVYNIRSSFKKSDQILAVEFLILCGVQFILSNTENYLLRIELSNPSYWSLLRFSVPFNVHIINAIVLMSTNRSLRRGLLRTCKMGKNKVKSIAMTQASKIQSNQNIIQVRPSIVVTNTIL
uniref:Uncharacterized protein n=1 Tax=Acrobeloides nanus TaxID=290746 RepID=A0A914CY30_9BILA